MNRGICGAYRAPAHIRSIEARMHPFQSFGKSGKSPLPDAHPRGEQEKKNLKHPERRIGSITGPLFTQVSRTDSRNTYAALLVN